MKQHIQIPFFALSILLTLSYVNADDAATPAIRYHRFENPSDPEGEMYHQFLPPMPERSFYDTQLKASANIDDTPEIETVVSILADGGRGSVFDGNWTQAFLLITTTKAGMPKKKKLFKVLDVADHAISIKRHPPPFILNVQLTDKPHGLGFKLIDLTGDGILDIWIEPGNVIVVISFQNGEFKEIFRSYSYTHRGGAEYVDIDNDGSYELKIPNRVYLDGFFRSAHPVWMNLYDWDGTAYVLNNEKFYTQENEIFFKLLSAYNHHLRAKYKYQLALETKDPALIRRSNRQTILSGDVSRYFEVYDFYIGLGYYFRGELFYAQRYLQSVATEAKNREYRSAADNMLKELWNKAGDKDRFISTYYSLDNFILSGLPNKC